ncbi:MAG: hypothetical protein Q4G05_04320 [Clostridia bacterium]|nr:hypothetical protein [Clostridia bacterium]
MNLFNKKKKYNCKKCKDTKFIVCPNCLASGISFSNITNSFFNLEYFYQDINNNFPCRICNGEKIVKCPDCNTDDSIEE